uniref:Uncharacterized protein n=1 Tax=uncultured marine thaumarchaeote AD1000_89_F09 TaxID=1455947 RepID=A0A075G0T8_9ARCH|nr:hypothetical protein [uncultured marine thaumarchaeote AD1000_89_F09]
MIGVNNLNTPTITLVDHEGVVYDEAVKRFKTGPNRVGPGENTTFDPSVVPDGEKYDFEYPPKRTEFFGEYCNGRNQIYVIAKTGNYSDKFIADNKLAYDELQAEKINPLFGRWRDLEDGITWLDTCYVDMSESDSEALAVGHRNKQKAITKLWLKEDENGNEKIEWSTKQVQPFYDDIGGNDE